MSIKISLVSKKSLKFFFSRHLLLYQESNYDCGFDVSSNTLEPDQTHGRHEYYDQNYFLCFVAAIFDFWICLLLV